MRTGSIDSHLDGSIDGRGPVTSSDECGPQVGSVWGYSDDDYYLVVGHKRPRGVLERLERKPHGEIALDDARAERGEDLLVKSFAPAEGAWAYNGIISHWKQA